MSFYTPPSTPVYKKAPEFLSGLFGGLKNLFTNPKLPAQYNSPYVPQTNIPSFYQVTEDDNNVQDVADKLGMPLPQLVSANQGIKTLPPKGSYIQTQQELMAQGVPPNIAAQQGRTPNYQGGTGSFVSGAGQVNLTELNASVQRQVAEGSLPQSVSFYTPIIDPTTGRPVTDQQMIANGYTYDNVTKQWKLPSASLQGTEGAPPPPNPNPRNVYYSRSRGFVTAEQARLLQRRRQRNQENRVVVTAADSDNAGGTPTSVLNVQIGSG